MSRPSTAFACAAACLGLAAGPALADDRPSRRTVREAVARVYEDERFEYQPPESSWFSDAMSGFAQFVADFHAAYPFLFWIVTLLLFVVCLLLIAHIVWTLRLAKEAEFDEIEAPLGDSVAALDPAPFLHSAESAWSEGRREQAIRDLYAALLISLDRREVVRYARHKALLDYRLEARGNPDAAELLARFERAYHPGSFGRRPPEQETFAELHRRIGALA